MTQEFKESLAPNAKMYKRPTPFRHGGGTSAHGDVLGILKPDSISNVWRRKFVPIRDWQGYLNAQKFAGASDEELEYYELQHKREYPPYQEVPRKKGYNTSPTIVKLKVKSDGVSVVVAENKLHTMLNEYCSRGKFAPRKVWVEAWIQAGRDFKDVLAGIVKMESRRGERFELLERLTKGVVVPVKPKKILKPVVKIS